MRVLAPRSIFGLPAHWSSLLDDARARCRDFRTSPYLTPLLTHVGDGDCFLLSDNEFTQDKNARQGQRPTGGNSN